LFLKFSNNRNRDSFSDLSEKELIIEYQNSGIVSIPGILFDPYVHLVFGICMKYLEDEDESKDAVMHIFENVVKDLKTHNIDNFKNWLYKVSKNHCLKVIRRRKQDKRYFDITKGEVSPNFMDFEDRMSLLIDGDETKKKSYLNDAIEGLSDDQKKCILLFYFEDKSYKEIVDITGFPLSKVKSYVQNGKRNLYNKLRKYKVFKNEG